MLWRQSSIFFSYIQITHKLPLLPLQKSMSSFNNIKELAQGYLQDVDLESLEKAYKFAEKIHADQIHPTSGEPYIVHIHSVTEILLAMKRWY